MAGNKMETQKPKCEHYLMYNGIVHIKVKEPEIDWVEEQRNDKPVLIERYTYFPERHQWHCAKCGTVIRLKVFENVSEVKQ